MIELSRTAAARGNSMGDRMRSTTGTRFPGVAAAALAVACAWFQALPAAAQPHIPKEQIPAKASAPVKAMIGKLYAADPDERLQAIADLGANKESAVAAVPFLAAMLDDAGAPRSPSSTRPRGARQPTSAPPQPWFWRRRASRPWRP